jgi:RNA recognition motif-containing protein
MMTKIYVGNLSWTSSEADVRDAFAQYGTVHSAAVVNDRETGRSRGFGFVEMDDADAQAAIRGLDGSTVQGRALKVSEAKARTERSGGPSDRW